MQIRSYYDNNHDYFCTNFIASDPLETLFESSTDSAGLLPPQPPIMQISQPQATTFPSQPAENNVQGDDEDDLMKQLTELSDDELQIATELDENFLAQAMREAYVKCSATALYPPPPPTAESLPAAAFVAVIATWRLQLAILC